MNAKLLVKIDRISAWILFFLMIIFIVTGYSMIGKYGMENIIRVRTAQRLHLLLDIPLVIAFLIHSGISIYFAFRRWGWIGNKK